MLGIGYPALRDLPPRVAICIHAVVIVVVAVVVVVMVSWLDTVEA